MAPAQPPARRPALLGCGLLAMLVLTLPGCGGEGTAAPQSAAAQQPKAKKETTSNPAGVGGGCPRQVDAFVDSLDSLRRQLAVGLSYEQYSAAVDDLHVSYDEIPIDRLAIDCLAATGTPSEQALNKHIDAVNAWGECLADTSCTTASIEPILQRKWRIASHLLSEAD
ncbi:MAG TPA: hypothetical protein VFI03_05965 [Solirubrobacterales bacterium]|nr:hypothetical protein [Solirubrobacterales bacterium]